MSHFNHTFITDLKKSRSRPTGVLPGKQYGVLVGILDHLTLNAADGSPRDFNHVYLWLHVNHGPQAGRYECAFNTESVEKSKVQYYVHEEPIENSDIPTPGFWPAKVSYQALGLKQANFSPIENGDLRSLVYHYAEQANIIAVYGRTYEEGNGMHDIHMNSGEKSDRGTGDPKNEDGVLVFYFRHETDSSRRAWVFIKFGPQTLAAK